SSCKSKSNHDSHLSNDSGCYSNTDRYSSPSDSSVLAEFKSRTLTRKGQKWRNSVCDSVILSCSSSDSSINVEPSDDSSNKKAQLLCDQLNQILSLSTSNHKPEAQVDSQQSVRQPSVSRAHTFNANDKSQRFVCKQDQEDGAKKSKISNLVKSSRRFFALSAQKSNDCCLVESRPNLKLNKKLCDLIAARLATEMIDLASVPYTDEMGFCKVPMALVKRYAAELNHGIQLVAKCIETERLAQIEKSGKLGIPNDFMYKECKCKKSISSDLIKWKLCKCDIDSSSLESFLFSLGLSMYIEKFKQRNIVKSLQDLKRLMDLNDHKQFEIAASITQSNSQTKSHFKILSNSIEFCEF
ncbi:SAM and SH3 domain-containing, partial [Brachionus plicatilis]